MHISVETFSQIAIENRIKYKESTLLQTNKITENK